MKPSNLFLSNMAYYFSTSNTYIEIFIWIRNTNEVKMELKSCVRLHSYFKTKFCLLSHSRWIPTFKSIFLNWNMYSNKVGETFLLWKTCANHKQREMKKEKLQMNRVFAWKRVELTKNLQGLIYTKLLWAGGPSKW